MKKIDVESSVTKAGLVPKLRFPEFRDSQGWDVKPFGQLFSIGNGRDYKHLGRGDIPVYGSGGYMLSVDDFLYDGESVCIGRKGTINNPIFLTGKFWTVDTLFYTYDFTECLPRFMFLHFQNINWLKHNEAGGVPSLSKTNIEKIKVAVPELDEQQKIAECLGSLDELIGAEREKLEALKAYKKGLMQQLFPREGETVPRLRFPEFRGSGEWESKNLGSFSEVAASGDLDEALFSETQTIEHQYPIYSNSVQQEGLYGYYSISRYPKNSVTITARGTLGIAFLRRQDFMGIGRLVVVSKIVDSDPAFVAACWNHLAKIPQEVTSIPQFTAIAARATVLPMPSLPEQQCIAACISTLDDRVSAQSDKIISLISQKQALMQQLFPSQEVNS